jgi:protein TonB
VPDELQAGERRTVQVKFWVGEDGSVSRLEVVQSGGAAFDNEVIRVLRKMPKWQPAVQNGHPVAVTFTQPVTFQSVEE